MTVDDQRSEGEATVVVVVSALSNEAEAMRSALQSLAGNTKAQAACLSYVLYRSRTDPSVFVTVERWTDETSFQTYLGSAEVVAAGRAMTEMLASAPAIHVLNALGDQAPDSGLQHVPITRTSAGQSAGTEQTIAP